MKRWPMREAARAKIAEAGLGDKVHKATLHTVGGRARLVAELPSWEELRQQARAARLRALDRQDELSERFGEALARRGVALYRADTPADASARIVALAREAGARVTKSKSMTSEEVGLNEALEAAGLAVTETDLGELIVQLARQKPSHLTAPALHLSAEDIARIFAEHLGLPLPAAVAEGETLPEDERRLLARTLSLGARAFLRERFLTADVGISGANFLVAESGTVVLVENEANIQLTTCLPRRHIVLAGIDKLIETEQDLGVLLQLLPVSATGQRQSCYVSLFADRHPDMHVVLLDHGRSTLRADAEQRALLTCIRCGACMNACPVYRNVGGHAYGGAYPGPIGAALLPHLEGLERFAELPFASSLCGACTEACPVGIRLDEHLLTLRARLTERGLARGLGLSLRAAAAVLHEPARVELSARLFPVGRPLAPLVPAGRAWTTSRDLPRPPAETFRTWWRRERLGRSPRTRTRPARSTAAITPSAGAVPAPSPPAVEAPVGLAPQAARPGEETLLARFARRFAELGPNGETELFHFASAPEALRSLGERMAAHPAEDTLVAGEKAAKRGYALGISLAALLIADTGGVVLDFPSRRANRVATLCETHVVVATPTALVAGVAEAVAQRTARRATRQWHDFQVLVTGPSRTADVEKTLVIPAHGPRRLVVVLCDEPVDLALLRLLPPPDAES